jgi:hypothetical protein
MPSVLLRALSPYKVKMKVARVGGGMRIFSLAILAALVSGCTSSLIMYSYKGKSLLDVVGDYGMPIASFDTPEGTRAFIWQLNHSGVVPGPQRLLAIVYLRAQPLHRLHLFLIVATMFF